MANSLPAAVPRSTFLRLEALLGQARQLSREPEHIRKAAHEITGEPGAGHTDHAVVGADGPNAGALLRLLGIGILDPDPTIDDGRSASTDLCAAGASS